MRAIQLTLQRDRMVYIIISSDLFELFNDVVLIRTEQENTPGDLATRD